MPLLVHKTLQQPTADNMCSFLFSGVNERHQGGIVTGEVGEGVVNLVSDSNTMIDGVNQMYLSHASYTLIFQVFVLPSMSGPASCRRSGSHVGYTQAL